MFCARECSCLLAGTGHPRCQLAAVRSQAPEFFLSGTFCFLRCLNKQKENIMILRLRSPPYSARFTTLQVGSGT